MMIITLHNLYLVPKHEALDGSSLLQGNVLIHNFYLHLDKPDVC